MALAAAWRAGENSRQPVINDNQYQLKIIENEEERETMRNVNENNEISISMKYVIIIISESNIENGCVKIINNRKWRG